MDRNLKILVIEDDEVDRMVICHTFANVGVNHEQLKVVESKKAVDALNNQNYGCVFLGKVFLSETESCGFLTQLLSLKISAPIVMMIQDSEEQIAEEFIKLGATDYVSKSTLSPEIIKLVIRNAIRIYQTQVQLAIANGKLQENQQLIIGKNQKIERQKQQIDLQNLKLIEALRLKSQFLATVSHELRTPMNAIIGFSQLLLRPKCSQLSHQQKDMVERILNNGKNLLMLVNEVLDFSKLQAGKLDLKPQIFDLSKLVKVTVAQMHSLAAAKKLAIEVDINLENPISYNDSLRVRQILNNLLSNAIKFTNYGTIWVKIEEIPYNWLQLEVGDTGIGIEKDNLQNIFEPLRQIDQGNSRRFGGTGLGLPVAQALVNMMGGKITVESELGKGSLFRIKLPRQVTSISEKDTAQKNYESSSKQLINNQDKENYQRKLHS